MDDYTKFIKSNKFRMHAYNTNNNSKYLRTRIRKFRQILEKSGINYDQIFKSIKNLASSRDTLNLYLIFKYFLESHK